jgi:hypothetical protein
MQAGKDERARGLPAMLIGTLPYISAHYFSAHSSVPFKTQGKRALIHHAIFIRRLTYPLFKQPGKVLGIFKA